MYLDIRVSTKKNGEKIAKGVLRKSIRKNGKVLHEDFGYLSGLTLDTLYSIRDVIKLSQPTTKTTTEKQTLQQAEE